MANVNQQAYNDWANSLNANKNFSMFNPTDAYTLFTSQVANAPTWRFKSFQPPRLRHRFKKKSFDIDFCNKKN